MVSDFSDFWSGMESFRRISVPDGKLKKPPRYRELITPMIIQTATMMNQCFFMIPGYFLCYGTVCG
jgi:hypothetical protein